MWRTTLRLFCLLNHKEISIHVPRVEDDLCMMRMKIAEIYFNPRPPCGGRHSSRLKSPTPTIFQSTSPVWRTTRTYKCRTTEETISIHVPRVEDDFVESEVFSAENYFNPRPPCGGRRIGQRHSTIIKNFNPRPPCGGRPTSHSTPFCFESISIHVPRVEDDQTARRNILYARYFNPRPPCGGRQRVD